MKIGNRVKTLRLSLNMTQAELAKLTGSAQASIQKIERGDTQTPRNIQALATALKCTPAFLLFGVDEFDQLDSLKPKNFKVPLIDVEQIPEFIRLGKKVYMEEKKETGMRCPTFHSEETFVLKVQGVSMNPTFQEGDYIYVDTERSAKHGDYVIAQADKEAQPTFRQLIIEAEHKFLKPANPNWPEQLLPLTENSKIIGKVIFTGKAL